jgi:protein-tyrosine-phosphatase
MSADARLVLIVCTANICRSPMGAAFLREHLRARGCTHVEVRSAGTHAQVGRAAMTEAREAVRAIRGQADDHVSSQLDVVSAGEADLILCAAREHRDHILAWWPQVDPARVRLFNEAIAGTAPVDVDDPYGWDADVFVLAARVIDRAMELWAEQLAHDWPAAGGQPAPRGEDEMPEWWRGSGPAAR